ncbi:alpha/beta fold hydrolase [Parvibaculum sedimenti]|uniref:Alpha/beta fold hydrolase n=1 Tax=Parvibaculum sedimenti TaxID=2608632 RepID=A0A6N6VPF8_9HYPH|nr:alpha/beta hydrolase [Parvibaculum sedimenti]KAB7741252.1 alpha/beta fold hydrolase [Parvibaculum sedimenti]
MDDIRFGRARVNDVDIHYAEAGPRDAPPVMLLHGFPEFWAGWRAQILALVAAGFRVIAPDQRGYNLSGKPKGVAAYDLDKLAADVVALADHFGISRLKLIGHDWGASVAWWLATTRPDRLERIVVINAPHPALWLKAMREDKQQRRKSWYVQMFRLPWLPEAIMKARNFRGLADGLVRSSRPGTFHESDVAEYRKAWSQPGALTATVNWYRALLKKRMPEALPWIKTPLLLIWGVEDRFGERSGGEASLALCENGRSLFVESATHWVHHEKPALVNASLIEFLRD